MEQVFLKPHDKPSYRVNPVVSADLAIAVRWVLCIQQRFYRYRCAKALDALGFKDEFSEQLITDDADQGYDDLIALLDAHIASQPPLALDANTEAFGQLIGLSKLETAIFRFVLIVRSWRMVFSDVRAARYYATGNDIFELVAHCLQANADDVEVALMPASTLAICQLVTMERSGDLADHFRSLRVFDRLFANDCDPKELIEKFSSSVPAPKLTVDDFPHLHDEVHLLKRLLVHALANRLTGCNFLLYGPPGTGKTELANWLGYQACQNVMAVSAFSGHEVHNAKSRLNAFLMCQRLYGSSGDKVLIFDEADDVLPSQLGITVGNSDALKMAINQLLETNATPCIWICNSIRHFDAAQLRRFTLMVQVNEPPEKVRQTIVERYLADTGVGADYLKSLAFDKHITPAMLAKLAEHHQAVKADKAEQLERNFDLMINPLLQARFGRDRLVTSAQPILPEYYNSNHCMATLAAQCRQHPDLRICLYGPPGTGKTSYASYLAREIDKPLLHKTASDLLGSYVGETERAIADAFREAEKSAAILLLDEVDTFMGARHQAERHWQKTMTNELLTQLDQYRGVLVCTTNFMEALDPAAVRRFDLKVQLDYLNGTQAMRLFKELLAEFGIQQSEFTHEDELSRWRLTPADFNLVKRQSRFLAPGALNAAALLQALQQEVQYRHTERSIGFVH